MSASLPEVVRAALEELSPEQQRAFALMVLHGVAIRQAAAQGAGRPEELQGHVVTALKHVKKRLDEAGLDVAGLGGK